MHFLHHADVLDDGGANAGEIKSAKKGIDVELAGTREVDEELHDNFAKFAQLAREFVDAGEFFLAAVRQKVDPLLGEGIEEFVEGFFESLGFFVGVDAGGLRGADGQSDAKDLRRFIFGSQRLKRFGGTLMGRDDIYVLPNRF